MKLIVLTVVTFVILFIGNFISYCIGWKQGKKRELGCMKPNASARSSFPPNEQAGEFKMEKNNIENSANDIEHLRKMTTWIMRQEILGNISRIESPTRMFPVNTIHKNFWVK